MVQNKQFFKLNHYFVVVLLLCIIMPQQRIRWETNSSKWTDLEPVQRKDKRNQHQCIVTEF